ncbi:type II secretion system minor pseudopilin GspJ [Saccharobesus litoralis]|nr:type II secretion system minor pseudopilin GspJ [Saccharobesus litoralis]
MKKLTHHRGFTLIEMLVAVAIFAVVGLGAANVLSSISTSNEVSLTHSERLQSLQLAILTIERDLRQATRRKVRVDGEKAADTFISHGELILDSQSQVLALRKVGWTNPMFLMPRSEVQSFAYRVVDDVLERIHFEYPDPVVGEEFKVRPLLTDVKELIFEFHDGKNDKWQTEWRSKDLPVAIAITLKLADYGDIRRVILMPEATK